MLCDECGLRKAAVYQRHSQRALCEECFEKDLIKRVERSLANYGVSKRERILLAVSGGKDSIAMMFLLSRIFPRENLRAVTIIEGVKGYSRSREVSICARVANELGVEYEAMHLKDIVGFSVSELVERSREMNLNISPCSFCGVLRRRALNVVAREQGVSKVATAHTLNDEVQTMMLNVLRGDTMRLVQWHPRSVPHSEKLVKRIKPLREIYEYELAIYAYLKGVELQEDQCPYLVQRPTLRFRFKEFLLILEALRPGIALRMLRETELLVEPLVNHVNRSGIVLPLCERCGEPTAPNRKLCRICEYLEALSLS